MADTQPHKVDTVWLNENGETGALFMVNVFEEVCEAFYWFSGF